jgi:transposase
MAKRAASPRRSVGYPSDVSDEEWQFVVPYLTLNRLDGAHRTHDLRAVFNAVRWLVRSGAPWRLLPLEVVKHTEATRGFVLLPRRWVVERSFAWAARFRRLARDYRKALCGRRRAGTLKADAVVRRSIRPDVA